MRKRSLARDWALKILYQIDITARDIDKISQAFWADEKNKDEEILEFCQRLIYGVRENLKAIDEKISRYATNWQLKRMAIIDRNILRLGVFELHYASDIPPKVTINEAVELAKRYGDLESSKFVNGILDKIHKTEFLSQSEKP
jgi:transcription antitermination factor NusB